MEYTIKLINRQTIDSEEKMIIALPGIDKNDLIVECNTEKNEIVLSISDELRDKLIDHTDDFINSIRAINPIFSKDIVISINNKYAAEKADITILNGLMQIIVPIKKEKRKVLKIK